MTMKRAISVMAFVLATVSAVAQFNAGGGKVSLKEFSMSGFGQDNSAWFLEGKGCAANGLLVSIQDFSLVFTMKKPMNNAHANFITPDEHGNINVKLASSDCSFNTVTHEIKGDSPVRIDIANNIRITGIGYDIDINHKVILLRSAVNMNMRVPRKALKKPSPSSLLHK